MYIAMDRHSLFRLLTHHMEGVAVDQYAVCELYAATLADISEKVTNDEMKRLLLVGSYLFHQPFEQDLLVTPLQQPQRINRTEH